MVLPASLTLSPCCGRPFVRRTLWLVALVLALPLLAATDGRTTVRVTCQPQVIHPGETTVFRFHLARPAHLDATVVGPDGLVIRRLLQDEERPAGTTTLFWDGRDDQGTMVPDEAYGLLLTLDGTEVTAPQPPADISFSPAITRLDDGGIRFTYTLAQPARVTIRAGIHQGPMLRTVAGGVVQPAGDHQLLWDGRDDTGHLQVTTMDGFTTTAQAQGYSGDWVVVQGSEGDYLSYRAGRQQARLATAAGPVPALAAGRSTVRFTVSGASGGRSAQGLAATVRRPLAGSAPVPATGVMDLAIQVAPEYLPVFEDGRFETVVFVDGRRYDEEENAFSPYTYRLDTRRLANGTHLVTINQVGLRGEIGSYSFTIEVNN